MGFHSDNSESVVINSAESTMPSKTPRAADRIVDGVDEQPGARQEGVITAPFGLLAFFQDLNPKLGDFRSDVLEGFAKSQKSISPKYFYDEKGSQIFEKITHLDAYYPTRTEQKIVIDNAEAIGAAIGPNRTVFEYGAGAVEKAQRLLALMADPSAYVAMDISRDFLIESASALADTLANKATSRESTIPIGAVCADFTTPLTLPSQNLPGTDKWLGFFPGSTIGNLDVAAATAFLTRASDTLGEDALFFFGVDLEKEEAVLRRAYDDEEGLTAAFNLNLLTRLHRELDATIDMAAFEHAIEIIPALSSTEPMRVEMHLRARYPTSITLTANGETHQFQFAEGETLHTENSHKYTLAAIDALTENTPWRRVGAWMDDQGWFATCLLSNSR